MEADPYFSEVTFSEGTGGVEESEEEEEEEARVEKELREAICQLQATVSSLKESLEDSSKKVNELEEELVHRPSVERWDELQQKQFGRRKPE